VRAPIAVVVATVAVGCRGEHRPTPVQPTPGPPVVVAAAIDASPAPPQAAADQVVDARSAAPDDWVDVAVAIPDAVLDMRYARADNFTGRVLYPVARCLLRRSVAERLARAQVAVAAHGRRLLIWDCYRPAALQRVMWDLVKDPRYVAKPVFDANGVPVSGSRHSRGAAVDVGLVDAAGAAIILPTEHDDFTSAAHRSRARKGKAKAELAVLDAALTAEGFVGMPTEWWHYDAPDALVYPLADVALDVAAP
jgi:D-alanyl-D-alanine dipeptidase